MNVRDRVKAHIEFGKILQINLKRKHKKYIFVIQRPIQNLKDNLERNVK